MIDFMIKVFPPNTQTALLGATNKNKVITNYLLETVKKFRGGLGQLKIQDGKQTRNQSECWKRNCLEIVLN